jgi:hypothetical protein
MDVKVYYTGSLSVSLGLIFYLFTVMLACDMMLACDA